MTVEVTVAAVVGMAISQRVTEERGRRATHDNQLNNDNVAYNKKAVHGNDEHDDDTTYDNNIASGFAIGWTLQYPAVTTWIERAVTYTTESAR